jgi:uncharacterized protein DUF6644
MFDQFMGWLEDSFLGHLMRDTGLWTYAVVNLFHILGVATLFGSILVLDVRLLGFWKQIPLVSLSQPTVTLAGTGFFIALVTGSGLLATKATEYIGNPFLYIKFPAILLGLMNVLIVHHSAAWKAHRTRELTEAERSRLAVLGGTSLACWLTAVTAGRMIAYW